MIVAIHQPDFMPWYGFFRKLAKSDVWIVLDHVLNSTHDASFWGRRVRLLISGTPHWLSVPLEKTPSTGLGGIPIHQMRIHFADTRAPAASIRTVRQAYARSPFIDEFMPLVETYFLSEEPLLVKRNLAFVQSVLEKLRIAPHVKFSSELAARGKATELLVNLVREVGGTTYLSGTGASGYLEPGAFAESGIRLAFNEFDHPIYPQRGAGAFVPGLSVLDALCSVGADQVSQWIHD